MEELKIDLMVVCETVLHGKCTKVLHYDYKQIYSDGQECRHGVWVILLLELVQKVSYVEQLDE